MCLGHNGGNCGFRDRELRGSVNGYIAFRANLADAPAVPNWSLDSGVLDDVVVTGGAVPSMHYARIRRAWRTRTVACRRAADQRR